VMSGAIDTDTPLFRVPRNTPPAPCAQTGEAEGVEL
jgi:hypothetical protein